MDNRPQVGYFCTGYGVNGRGTERWELARRSLVRSPWRISVKSAEKGREGAIPFVVRRRFLAAAVRRGGAGSHYAQIG